jgi:putative radical SAM enzyme (TIGR03279 family)
MGVPASVSPYESLNDSVYPRPCRAVIERVDPGSPAQKAGLEAGDVIVEVEGVALRDIIEWRWQADGFEVEVRLEGGEETVITRDLGQDWGITFSDSIFDGTITCCNGCSFCFMTMLPDGMRPTLYLRDDDYRLSFLQGNFVTLTNVTDDDIERIVQYGLSPLHVSLHGVTAGVRESLMGKNAARGMEVLEQLLDAGIEVHVQVVVVPGVNDGAELTKTLSWIESHPAIRSAGFVPLGYTKFQKRFDRSFSDDPDAAAEVIELIREFQEDSGTETRMAGLQIADEFYIDAGYDFPPAQTYEGYPQFQDGIGMMRSFIDEWNAIDMNGYSVRKEATIVTGTAFAKILDPLVQSCALAGKLRVLPIENTFFGGNVDVTCLLTGFDIIPALQSSHVHGPVIMPAELFNAQHRLLDDISLVYIEETCDVKVHLCTYNPADILRTLIDFAV